MKFEQPKGKTFSKEEIFSALDSILETGPLNLCGITTKMPVEFNVPRDMAWGLFKEWVEMAVRRYRKVVDSNGRVVFKLRNPSDGYGEESAPGTDVVTDVEATYNILILCVEGGIFWGILIPDT